MSQRVSQTPPGSSPGQRREGTPDDAAVPGAAPGGAGSSTGPGSAAQDQLGAFEGPADELARRVLDAQMRLGGAVAGAMISRGADGSMDLLAALPGEAQERAGAPAWLSASAEGLEQAARCGASVAGRLPEADRAVVVIPSGPEARLEDGAVMLSAFLIDSVDPLEVDAARDRLSSAAVLTALVASRLALHEVGRREEGLRHAAELLASVNAHGRFQACAMALVNEAASRLRATRVSLTLARSSAGVECVAVSHTERFVRAGALVRDLEAAHDEAVDQDADTCWPQPPGASHIARQAAEVARRHGPSSVSALVLRVPARDEPVGALLVEREPERPLDAEEARWLRLGLDLVAPRLVELDERDAWFGRRMALAARRGVRGAASPKHSAWKLGALGAAAALASLFVIPTNLESRGTFTVEPLTRRVVAAPFQGTLAEVRVRVGDPVRAAETVLATLDTTEPALKLAEARAQRDALLRQAEAARATPSSGSASVGAIAEARLLEAQAEEATARVRLLESRLARAELKSPIDGVVTAGDIERLRGAAVNVGDTLFEVTAPGELVADLALPEARAAGVVPGGLVTLRPTGRPDVELKGTVERVSPFAEVVNLTNVIKVRVKFDAAPPEWLRPGMEGVAAVRTGRASLARAWTRDASDWLRLKLWW